MSTASLEKAIQAAGQERGLPPVDKWNPPDCGEIDMEIRADGTWFYGGTPIGRERLVKLFASVLRRDGDGHTYLVTPVEKVRIRVEDAPFQAVEMFVEGSGAEQMIDFRTKVGDRVEVGPEHRLRFEREEGTDGVKPYVHVRGRLEALVVRSVMYDLMELTEKVDGKVVVRSRGEAFAVMDASEVAGL